MSVTNYKAKAKEVLDLLPDGKIRIAFNLLERLSSLGASTELIAGAEHGWLGYFADDERAELLDELLGSIAAASSDGNWLQVREVIQPWKETAEILSDEQLMTEIRTSEEQSRSGETISWETVKNELGLK